jgi:hypothetical protein
MIIDLHASIIPKLSAAGVKIGDSIQKIISNNPDFEMDNIGETSLYHFENICLWVIAQKVTQISVFNNYRGMIHNKIGLSSTIQEVQNEFGEISQDEDDNFITPSQTGWSFETDDWNTDSEEPQFEKNLNIEISEIFIQKL